MRRLAVPRGQVDELLALLNSGAEFEVVEKLSAPSLPTAFALMGFGVSWGHFARAASCAVAELNDATLELRLSYLNVQRTWSGRNPFRSSDQKVEQKICQYVSRSIPAAVPLEDA